MRRIRAMETRARLVSAAALTAFGAEQQLGAVEAGYRLFLSKPVAPEELARSLSTLAATRRSEGYA